MRSEGFKVAIDSVTPDMIDYLNLSSFDVDQIKINVSKDRAAQLDDRRGIRRSVERPSLIIASLRVAGGCGHGKPTYRALPWAHPAAILKV